MDQPRIYLHPGEVRSKVDGDIHYINAPKLARLYGVDYKKCYVIYETEEGGTAGYGERETDIHLFPRFDGDYYNVMETL